jgi:hypothetical protein
MAASPAGVKIEPWQPYQAENFTTPAGRYCTFALQVTAVEDAEQVRVDARYPDGSVRVNEYKGTLVSDFTNVTTGKAVRRDLSGRAWVELRPDGAFKSFTGVGPFSLGFRAVDDYPQGYYRLAGVHSVTFDADGTRHLAVDGGTEENLCATLA